MRMWEVFLCLSFNTNDNSTQYGLLLYSIRMTVVLAMDD